jgi:hypothetical protein
VSSALAFASFTTALVLVGALLTLRTPRRLAAAEPLVQRAARFERGIARIVVVLLVLVCVALNLLRNWNAGGIALMAGMFSALGLAVLSGAITLAARLTLRYRGSAIWQVLGYEIAGFALMGLGALLRYGSAALA